jgi:15-cis-phytoene synthase
VPLVHPESRPSLWAMIEIYHRLLLKIKQSGFEVLSQRVRLPATEKVWIVVRGFTGSFNRAAVESE